MLAYENKCGKAFCYAVIAYKTAWLSYYYPVEFAIANCTINQEQESITKTLAMAKKRKIPILGPDINRSDAGFTCEIIDGVKSIRYGIKAIKGIGGGAFEFFTEYKRLSNAMFNDFDDYYKQIHRNNEIIDQMIEDIRERTGKRSTNPMKKDVEEALILSGAFDYCEPNRYKLWCHYMYDIRKEKPGKTVKLDEDTIITPDPNKYKRKDKLMLEKHFMGTYISEHPLDPFPYTDIDSCEDNEVVQISGFVTGVIVGTTKKGKTYITVKFKSKDDIERKVNVFDEDLAISLKNDLKKNQIIIIKGRVSKKYNNITASSLKIAVFQKQVLPQTELEIEVKQTKETTTPNVSVKPDILGDALNSLFN